MSYNLIVLGGGPGGYTSALRGAALGAKVALVEKAELGGLCLNWGCIPTKTYYHASFLKEKIKKMPKWGISVTEEGFSLAKVTERKELVISTLKKGIEFLLKGRKVDVYKGEGILLSPRQVKVGEQVLTGENILIATGTYAAFPPALTPNGENILSSSDMLNLKDLPASLLVVGAGVLGLEFASIYRSFGSEVTVVEIMPQILPQEDPLIAEEVRKLLTRQGIKFYTGTTLTEMKAKDGKTLVEFLTPSGIEKIEVDKVLIATGRKPLVPQGAKEIGLAIDKDGTISINDDLSTNIQGIYAAGDVSYKIQLAHLATHMGLGATENALLKKNKPVDLRIIPRVTYIHPPLALVGLTMKEATEAGIKARMVKVPWTAVGMALIEESRDGFCSFTVEEGSEKILGVQILGHEAPNLISEGLVIVQEGLTLTKLSEVIHPHPTLGEIYFETAEAGRGLGLHTLG